MADSYSVQSREGATKREVPLTPEEKQAWSAKIAKQKEEDAIIAEHKAKEDRQGHCLPFDKNIS